MELAENLEYVTQAIARLIDQFRESGDSNQEKLLRTYVEEVQEWEAAAFEVLLDRWLDTAVGVQLDGLGQIIGRERLGADDDTYRLLLKSQVILNLSSGTVQQIIDIVALVIPGVDLELRQEFPAGFELIADDQPLDSGVGPTVAAIVGQARAAGVRGLFQYYETNPVFRFDGSGSSKFDGGYFFSTTIEG